MICCKKKAGLLILKWLAPLIGWWDYLLTGCLNTDSTVWAGANGMMQ